MSSLRQFYWRPVVKRGPRKLSWPIVFGTCTSLRDTTMQPFAALPAMDEEERIEYLSISVEKLTRRIEKKRLDNIETTGKYNKQCVLVLTLQQYLPN